MLIYVGGGKGPIFIPDQPAPAPAPATNGIVVLQQEITLAMLKAKGAVATASFNIGAALPANARVIPGAVEIQVVQTLGSDSGITSTVLTVEATSEGAAAGSLLDNNSTGSKSVLTRPPGLYGLDTLSPPTNGLYTNFGNGYMSRGGQQLQATIQLLDGGSPTFALLNAGDFIVRLLYAVA